MAGGNTLKCRSTQILASLQTKVPAHWTSTRHFRRTEMPSILGLSHAFWIISSYFRVLGRCPEWKVRSTSWTRTRWGPCWSSCSEVWLALWSYLSGAKCSPETLLKVTLPIHFLWTWHFIKVSKTCPYKLWFNLEKIQAVTKKVLSN